MSAHNRIKKLRKEKGLSQKEFAKAFNEFSKDDENVKSISYATVSRWENGENEPKLETWIKIADFFHVSVSYLQGIDEIDYGNDYQEHFPDIKSRDKTIRIYNQVFKELFNEYDKEFGKIDAPTGMFFPASVISKVKNDFNYSYEKSALENLSYLRALLIVLIENGENKNRIIDLLKGSMKKIEHNEDLYY